MDDRPQHVEGVDDLLLRHLDAGPGGGRVPLFQDAGAFVAGRPFLRRLLLVADGVRRQLVRGALGLAAYLRHRTSAVEQKDEAGRAGLQPVELGRIDHRRAGRHLGAGFLGRPGGFPRVGVVGLELDVQQLLEDADVLVLESPLVGPAPSQVLDQRLDALLVAALLEALQGDPLHLPGAVLGEHAEEERGRRGVRALGQAVHRGDLDDRALVLDEVRDLLQVALVEDPPQRVGADPGILLLDPGDLEHVLEDVLLGDLAERAQAGLEDLAGDLLLGASVRSFLREFLAEQGGDELPAHLVVLLRGGLAEQVRALAAFEGVAAGGAALIVGQRLGPGPGILLVLGDGRSDGEERQGEQRQDQCPHRVSSS